MSRLLLLVMKSTHSFMDMDGIDARRDLADRPIFIFDPSIAECKSMNNFASSRISEQPTLRASAFLDGNSFGLTNDRLLNPIVFMALAVDPILPG
jgi:hypothetical protein